MKKVILLALFIFFGAMSASLEAYAESNENMDFEVDSIQYKITVPAENGLKGEAMMVGVDDKLTRLIIPDEVSYGGSVYIVTSINVDYGKDERVSTGFFAREIVIPESVKEVKDNYWGFNGSVQSITFRCHYSAIKNIRVFYLAPAAIGAVAYVPEAELDEYTSGFNERVFTDFSFGSEIYDRELYGITVAAIGEKDVVPDRFYDGNAFFEVIDKEKLNIRMIGVTLEKCIFAEEVCETGVYTVPQTASYKGRTYTVTSLGSHCLCQAHGIIMMPDTITEIEPECIGEDVVGVYMSNSVTEIPENMFDEGENWPALTFIKLSDNLKSIPRKAFYRCLKLRGVTIPESVTKIGTKAFRKNVKTVYIKGSIPGNIKNFMGYMKDTTFYVGGEYEEELKKEMASKIAAGKAKVKVSGFRESKAFGITPTSINTSETDSLQMKVLRDKNADGKIAWCTNTYYHEVSQKGEYVNKGGSAYVYSGIYAFDILSGKFAYCRLVEPKPDW